MDLPGELKSLSYLDPVANGELSQTLNNWSSALVRSQYSIATNPRPEPDNSRTHFPLVCHHSIRYVLLLDVQAVGCE
jgi:hypothetical protein